MLEATMIVFLFLGAVIGFCVHGLISPGNEPEINIFTMNIPEKDDGDEEE